jgi:hypothetical protein
LRASKHDDAAGAFSLKGHPVPRTFTIRSNIGLVKIQLSARLDGWSLVWSLFNTTRSLNKLALVFQTQGDLAGARPLFERALAIRVEALGPAHPDTAASLNKPRLSALGSGRPRGRETAFRARADDYREGASRGTSEPDWAERALRDDGLVIDLAGMQDVAVDPQALVATVAGGAQAKTAPGRT